MTLENLLAIKRLQAHEADRVSILKLLDAAERNLQDARHEEISADNRFDMAYKCIMQCAMVGLSANGFRTATSQPGHHQTAIQCLHLTMQISQDDIIVLDALRRQRNVVDYEGDMVSEATLIACVEQPNALLEKTRAWLAVNRRNLI